MSTSVARNPVGYLRRSVSFYRQLLFDPESFYDDLGNRGLRSEFLLVLFIGLVGSAAGYYAMTELLAFAGDFLSDSATMRMWRLAASPIVGIFLLWFGGTAAIYVVSWMYTNTGSFFHLLKNMAWALAPFLVVDALRGIGLVIASLGLPGANDPQPGWVNEAQNIVDPTEQANFIWEQVASEPLVVGLTVLGWLFVLWSGYIAARGVAEVRNLDRDESYIVVAVPVVLYLGYTAATVFGIL